MSYRGVDRREDDMVKSMAICKLCSVYWTSDFFINVAPKSIYTRGGGKKMTTMIQNCHCR